LSGSFCLRFFSAFAAVALALAFSIGSNVKVLAAWSSVSFAASPSFHQLQHPRAVGIADFNADGKPDVVVASDSANKVSNMLGNSSGGFTSGGTLDALARPISLGWEISIMT
jgi:hypothetical protein